MKMKMKYENEKLTQKSPPLRNKRVKNESFYTQWLKRLINKCLRNRNDCFLPRGVLVFMQSGLHNAVL
jgi:hypothetical protein